MTWITPPGIQITGGPWLEAQEITAKRLCAYRPDDLLHCFRQTAGLAPAGTPPKGWEAPTSELRGHFTGHALSAMARAIRCGYTDLAPNLVRVVYGLRQCQNALGSGYVSAFPESFIDRVIAREKVWAPWYTLHKIGQGLLDAHVFSDTPLAGDVCRKFVGWVQQRMDALSDEDMQQMLATEHGGMSDFLAQAATVFDDASTLVLAKRFLHLDVIRAIQEDNWKWFEGRHANTQIPIVIGMARIGILENDDKLIDAAALFVNQVLTGWTYPNGGNSDLEHFGLFGRQHDHISAETSETCNTHNMAKLVTLLSTVQACAHWDAWLNHACENHLLAAREPGGPGLMYYFPLIAGSTKKFDNPNEDFWCCSGTGIETPFLLPEWLARVRNTATDPFIDVVQGIPFTLQAQGKMLCLTEAAGGGHTLTCSAGSRVVEGAALGLSKNSIRWEALPGDPTSGSFFYGSTLLAFTGLSAPVAAGCIITEMLTAIETYLVTGNAGALPLTHVPAQAAEIGLMPITSIHSETYTCIVQGFTSSPDFDAWKHRAKSDYQTQANLDAITHDVVFSGAEASELTHDTVATPGSYAGVLGPFTVRDIRTGQTYTTGVNLPSTGPCSIAITYWGGEFRRRFTVRIGDADFLQCLELDKPNQPVTFCYPIPGDTPRDVPLIVSIDPEPGGYAGLVLAIRSIRFTSAFHQPFRGETTMQTTPQLTPILHTEITFRDAFWKPRIDRNRDVTLPHVLEKCEETGRFGNLRAAGRKNLGNPAPQTCEGYCFNDSDVYKAIEGAANILAVKRDAKIERRVDAIIALIAQAQEPDGYLYSPKTIGDPNNLPPGGTKRWESMDASHELYCVGHLYEAAVAHFHATGKRNLLNIAIKNANLVSATFGPGKRGNIDGHPEVELGLSDLYGATGDARYLRLAQWFLARRGDTSRKDLVGEYAQDHKPLVKQDEAVGHAVRAAYCFGAAEYVGNLAHDAGLRAVADRLWDDVVGYKMYITGGIGSRGSGEALGDRYELPNRTAYQETCASIAFANWTNRMGMRYADAKYADILERTVYNAVLSGVGLSGKNFFYVNSLQSDNGAFRPDWFGCACCPPNILRFIGSIGKLFAATGGNTLYVNLFAASDIATKTAAGPIHVAIDTVYPENGAITIKVKAGTAPGSQLAVRIPGWAKGEAVPGRLYRFADTQSAKVTATLNGKPLNVASTTDGYIILPGTVSAGDTVKLDLPMPVRKVVSNPGVMDNRGKVAYQRGPLVYCFEGSDQAVKEVFSTVAGSEGTAKPVSDTLGGITPIAVTANAVKRVGLGGVTLGDSLTLTGIPYATWANRGASSMAVWLPGSIDAAEAPALPTIAKMAKVRASFGANPSAVNDQKDPAKSIDHNHPFYHYWPHKGTAEWLEYTFPKAIELGSVGVYWFDDTGIGECRLPTGWSLDARVNGAWVPVKARDPFGSDGDKYVHVRFDAITTDALRLNIQSQKGWAGGVHEWRVYRPDGSELI